MSTLARITVDKRGDEPDQKPTYPLSVVIPTLGGPSLAKTVAYLNQGSVVPAEIFICIPQQESPRAAGPWADNVTVVVTPCRGQVAQRAYGFKRVAQPVVLQLDDDILVDPEDLARLLDALQRLGHGNAVAPIYRDSVTGQCLHAYPRHAAVACLKSLFATLICGARWGLGRMGTLSAAGTSYGVDENHCAAALVETEWQPGGCVLSYRDELISEDYFPFAGKAYCEDALHSLLRKRRGMRLWVISTACCVTPANHSDSFDLRALRADLKVRRHLVRVSGGQIWRLHVWFATDVLKRFVLSAVDRLFARAGR